MDQPRTDSSSPLFLQLSFLSLLFNQSISQVRRFSSIQFTPLSEASKSSSSSLSPGARFMIMGIRRNSSSINGSIVRSPPSQAQDHSPRFGSLECGYYDVQPVQQISKALLLTLGTACVEGTAGDLFSSPKSIAADVRQEMIDYIAQQCERYGDRSCDKDDPEDNPVCVIEGFLENFVRSKKTLLRRVSSKFFRSNSGCSDDRRIDEAVAELDRSGVWPAGRRDSLARSLIKRVDRGKRRIYCEKGFDSNDDLMQHNLKCRFRPMDCPSHGCDAIFSAARSAEHDSLCLFKLLPCEQKCRALVMRGEMKMHCSSICEMRPISCPFEAVGCSRMIPQGEIQRHCEQEMGSHLLSVLQILRKLDNSSSSQSQRLVLLEKAVSIAQRFESVDVNSLMITLREQEGKIKSLELELSKLRQEMKVTDVSAEVLQLRRELKSLQKRIDNQQLPNSPKNGIITNNNGHHSQAS